MSHASISLPLYVVDAFVPPETKTLGKGNPAAVVPLTKEQVDSLSVEHMQTVATELGLSETTYVYPADEQAIFYIRWFTPAVEVQLCGHATLAAAYVLHLESQQLSSVEFITMTGERLKVKKAEQPDKGLPAFQMEFPALLQKGELTESEERTLTRGLGIPKEKISQCYRSDYDLVAVLPERATVEGLKPLMETLSKLGDRGVIATAPCAEKICFVSRYFAPAAGIPEDPVTGSAHCALAPLYLTPNQDGKFYRAEQLSRRRGVVMVRMMSENRVELQGSVRLVSKGTLYL
ncbi:isomerase [Gracilaria domingensis]|nr:isomerase [Gracilaria domingensis]